MQTNLETLITGDIYVQKLIFCIFYVNSVNLLNQLKKRQKLNKIKKSVTKSLPLNFRFFYMSTKCKINENSFFTNSTFSLKPRIKIPLKFNKRKIKRNLNKFHSFERMEILMKKFSGYR